MAINQKVHELQSAQQYDKYNTIELIYICLGSNDSVPRDILVILSRRCWSSVYGTGLSGLQRKMGEGGQ